MPTSVRRRLAAASFVLLAPALGACGFNEQTNQVYQPAVGVNNRDGDIDVLGAVLVSSTEGEGAFIASLVGKSNSQADELARITGDGIEATIAEPIEVKPDVLVNLAEGDPVRVTGDDVAEGRFVRLTLEFSSGQQTEVNVPVVRQEGEYASLSPASSPSPSGSPSSSPGSSPSDKGTEKPGASGTPSP